MTKQLLVVGVVALLLICGALSMWAYTQSRMIAIQVHVTRLCITNNERADACEAHAENLYAAHRAELRECYTVYSESDSAYIDCLNDYGLSVEP